MEKFFPCEKQQEIKCAETQQTCDHLVFNGNVLEVWESC